MEKTKEFGNKVRLGRKQIQVGQTVKKKQCYVRNQKIQVGNTEK